MTQTWHEGLLGEDAPDWFALEDDNRAELVESGHARTTWRVTLTDGTVFAKVQERGGLADRIKRMAFGSAAEREWRVSRAAERRTVPVVRGIGVGVLSGPRRRYAFLSEALADAVSLTDAWERAAGVPGPRQRHGALGRLIEATASLFATAHDRGFFHRDAHPRNILIGPLPAGGVEARFVDVHGARLAGSGLSMRRSVKSLAQLDQYFRRHAGRLHRLRFLSLYLSQRESIDSAGTGRDRSRLWLWALEGAGRTHGERLARHRNRRLRGDGKYFQSLSLSGGWKATVALKLERRHRFPEPDIRNRTTADWQAILQSTIAAISGSTSAALPTIGQEVSVEMNRAGSLMERLLFTLRGSPHQQAFERCHKLRHRDADEDLILGYARRRRAGLVDATLLFRPVRDEAKSTDAPQHEGTSCEHHRNR